MESYSAQDFRNLFDGRRFDIDFYSVNVTVNENLTEFLKRLVGETIGLAFSQGRAFQDRSFYRRYDFSSLTLSETSTIIETKFQVNLKRSLCKYFREKGQIVMPADDEKKFLIKGHRKFIPTNVFADGLRSLGVHYIRITNFGMKQFTSEFTDFSRSENVCNCVAEQNGYPPNCWDISLSCPHPQIFVVKALHTDLLPRDVKLDKYDVFGPLDTRDAPQHSHGGNLTIQYKNGIAESCIQVKFYSLIYHFIRAANKYKLETLPNTTQWGFAVLTHFAELLDDLKKCKDDIGGFRLESRVVTKTFREALRFVRNEEPFDFFKYFGQSEIEIRAIAINDFLHEVEKRFIWAQQELRKQGVTAHHGRCPLNSEAKRIFGDVVSLFGIFTRGIKTQSTKPTAWWRVLQEREQSESDVSEFAIEEREEKSESDVSGCPILERVPQNDSSDSEEAVRSTILQRVPQIDSSDSEEAARSIDPFQMFLSDSDEEEFAWNKRSNDVLIEIAEHHRRQYGQMKINWKMVAVSFKRQFSNCEKTIVQIRNHYKWLIRR